MIARFKEIQAQDVEYFDDIGNGTSIDKLIAGEITRMMSLFERFCKGQGWARESWYITHMNSDQFVTRVLTLINRGSF